MMTRTGKYLTKKPHLDPLVLQLTILLVQDIMDIWKHQEYPLEVEYVLSRVYYFTTLKSIGGWSSAKRKQEKKLCFPQSLKI